jgi:hypothetical protein
MQQQDTSRQGRLTIYGITFKRVASMRRQSLFLAVLCAAAVSLNLAFVVPSAHADEEAKLNARIEAWGRNCKNALLAKYGKQTTTMADIQVELGATLKQGIDAGQITLADIKKSGLSYNFTMAHSKGKDGGGYCNTDGEGNVKELVKN